MIKDALRLIRIFHDLKQGELAEKLEVSKSHLSEIESGKKQPTLELLGKYSTHFNMPLSSIIFFSENIGDASFSSKSKKYISSKVLMFLDILAEAASGSEDNGRPQT